MKKLLIGVTTIFFLIVLILGVVFVKPELIINPTTVGWLLNRSSAVEEWHWQDAEIRIDWKRWNLRRLHGHFKNFCLEAKPSGLDVDTCIEMVSWDFFLSYELGEGPRAQNVSPLSVEGRYLELTLLEGAKKKAPEKPVNVWKLWRRLWSDSVPDFIVNFERVLLKQKEKEQSFDLFIEKERNNLKASASIFELRATPEEIVVSMPERWRLPKNLGLSEPLYFRNLELRALMSEHGIPLQLTGSLAAIDINVNSRLDLPLTAGLGSPKLRKELLLNTVADLELKNIKKNVRRYGPPPYNALPAPLNVMNGDLKLRLEADEAPGLNDILIKGVAGIDLRGEEQALVLDLLGSLELDVASFERGPLKIGVDLEEVALRLPRLSKTSLPPQFFPDSRIKKSRKESTRPPKRPIQAQEERPSLYHITAEGEEALHIKSNLLDEALRLNLELLVAGTQIQQGYVEILPLETTVFKRPIEIPKLRFIFDFPNDPVVKGSVIFKLPEYEITMNLEGPVSNPAYAFKSKPPLSQDDIYSVLLFGRPMSELNPDDSASAKRTNQILSQGLLSLSVLYFLAGSPVEYVGYDPESKEAAAQIGIDQKSSLQVRGGEGGWKATSVRRSLGKGWYIDTSVQQATSLSREGDKTYGVLLERVLAY